ncbi:V-type ATP synthase subunit E [Aerococcus kribbianus]|uniref:V-type ATP synthase subunit E n=1 Tax=Aerococcus kribbianus TaxID=2999064 RepID=A0A9X3FT80_9LACT|nr:MULTISPECIES: V-type ATP synthase subunit E [unclassified Aerococcus]MCZ0717918.1 V-type ATP synthase subunit E [Aerococcus sp. YH-aer221]MCZ0726205.1 V-type ATP synthase subunit E [Aerococcus sp. YH-aer222]
MAEINDLTQNVLDKVRAKEAAELEDLEKELASEKDQATKAIADDLQNDMDQAQSASQAELQRQKQSYENKMRNQILQGKQHLIDQSYQAAIDQLNAMDSSQFADLIKDALKQVPSGQAVAVEMGEFSQNILSDQDKTAIQNADSQVTFTERTVADRSGFILASQGMDYNFTFEAIIAELKDQLAPEIVKRGF